MGKLITLEGIEGVGKSSHLPFILEKIGGWAPSVIATREPGGTWLANQLRELLLTPSAEKIDPKTELLLMFAARAQHVSLVIKPALMRGDWVVCDRFIDSTYAYQGAGRGLPLEPIAFLESFVQETVKPDLTLLFDAPVDIAFSRLPARQTSLDRLEAEELSFFERIRQAFLKRAEADPNRFRVIDAAQSWVQVRQQIECCLIEWYDNLL